jgi:hypothetical protein
MTIFRWRFCTTKEAISREMGGGRGEGEWPGFWKDLTVPAGTSKNLYKLHQCWDLWTKQIMTPSVFRGIIIKNFGKSFNFVVFHSVDPLYLFLWWNKKQYILRLMRLYQISVHNSGLFLYPVSGRIPDFENCLIFGQLVSITRTHKFLVQK